VSASVSQLLFASSDLNLTLVVTLFSFVIGRIIGLRDLHTVLVCRISTFNHLTLINLDANINTISGQPSPVLFSSLQSVITTWQTRRHWRWERHWCYFRVYMLYSNRYGKTSNLLRRYFCERTVT